MGQYISKAAVVAEIESLKRTTFTNFDEGVNCAVQTLLEIIDNLEVKDEVDSSHPIKAMQEALCTEYEKGRADVLRCIDPDVMVADFCSQPLSKTRSIASVYRQGISDILKRINNNEKTSTTGTHSIDDGGVR